MTISIGVIGYGHFGRHLADDLLPRFAKEIEVKVSDPEMPVWGRFVSESEAATCAIVFLAVPIRAYEEAIKAALPHVRPETLFVDVASVKGHTAALLRQYVGNRCRYLATHPMFGPESYQKRSGTVDGFKIVMTETNLCSALYLRAKRLLTGFGFSVVEMTPEEHDAHLARTLFLTHYVGQIVHRAGFDRTPMDTVSFGSLMDAVKSVAPDEKLFADVYHFAREACDKVLKEFWAAQEAVNDLFTAP